MAEQGSINVEPEERDIAAASTSLNGSAIPGQLADTGSLWGSAPHGLRKKVGGEGGDN
ncbi:hypothetical protein [Streptomyces sp. NPDC050738]|uniref:hypothetical protein n=1 Tax=Streptomyces sp. NPDC050738 TaxID=3154744 RepID=UPI00343355D1